MLVLCKLPVPGRPTNLDHSRARAYCACSRCGGGEGVFGPFFSRLSILFFLWETARCRLKYCVKGPLSPTNEPTDISGPLAFPFRKWTFLLFESLSH